MPSEVELAYAAGIVDGEGCVAIKRTLGNRLGGASPRYNASVTVTSADMDIMEWLHSRFGGMIRTIKKIEGRKLLYQWRVTHMAAIRFLYLITPYMIIKRKQAAACMVFQTSVSPSGGMKLSDEILEFREKCFQAVKTLNDYRGGV